MLTYPCLNLPVNPLFRRRIKGGSMIFLYFHLRPLGGGVLIVSNIFSPPEIHVLISTSYVKSVSFSESENWKPFKFYQNLFCNESLDRLSGSLDSMRNRLLVSILFSLLGSKLVLSPHVTGGSVLCQKKEAT